MQSLRFRLVSRHRCIVRINSNDNRSPKCTAAKPEESPSPEIPQPLNPSTDVLPNLLYCNSKSLPTQGCRLRLDGVDVTSRSTLGSQLLDFSLRKRHRQPVLTTAGRFSLAAAGTPPSAPTAGEWPQFPLELMRSNRIHSTNSSRVRRRLRHSHPYGHRDPPRATGTAVLGPLVLPARKGGAA